MIGIHVYGVSLRIESDWKELTDFIHWDYGFFVSNKIGQSPWEISIVEAKPEKDWGKPLVRTHRSRLFFSNPGVRRILFFNQVFVECDFNAKRAKVYHSRSRNTYEAVYFLIEAILTFELNELGLVRIHAMGAVTPDGLNLVLGKSGAGKSSLFLEWLRYPNVRFLGDDLVVLSRSGAFAYPVKISFKENPAQIPPHTIRTVDRFQYGRRYLVEAVSMRGKITGHAQVKNVVHLVRGQKVSFIGVGRHLTLIWFLRWLVAGLETPQIVELSFPVTPRYVLKRLKHLWQRFGIAWALSSRADGYTFNAPEGKSEMAEVLYENLSHSSKPSGARNTSAFIPQEGF